MNESGDATRPGDERGAFVKTGRLSRRAGLRGAAGAMLGAGAASALAACGSPSQPSAPAPAQAPAAASPAAQPAGAGAAATAVVPQSISGGTVASPAAASPAAAPATGTRKRGGQFVA